MTTPRGVSCVAKSLTVACGLLLLTACNTTVESTSARARPTRTVPTESQSEQRDADAAIQEQGVPEAPPEPYAPRPITQSSGLATGRGLRTVELVPLDFSSDIQTINGSIELCLSPELRNRPWNVGGHPFRVGLGSRASLNVERLTKATFSDVSVILDRNCPSGAGIPTIDIRIRSANRDPYREVEGGLQNTSITLEATLFDSDGAIVWTHRQQALSEAPRAGRTLFSSLTRNRHRHAAREFGQAVEKALRGLQESILNSNKVREIYAPRDQSPTTELAPPQP